MERPHKSETGKPARRYDNDWLTVLAMLTIFFFHCARSFNSWFWLVALLGFGSKYLCFNNGILKYARVAVLPFYILHQTVIVVIGYYIADWEASVMVKYLTLSTLSFVVIIAIYDLLIRRLNALRLVFGMKAKN